MALNRAFWHGRRVLVTGHTGFKGSWLSLWLQAMGAEVTGLALPPPGETAMFDVAQVGLGMASHMVDVRNADAVQRAVRLAAPEVILHLAAQSLVRPSYADPVATYATNVMGTVHLLQAARSLADLKAVVVVTSDKCYDNREWLWGYRENEALGGHDPYSSSKACAELVTAAFRDSYFAAGSSVAIASARAGNVVGGGDWAVDRLIPDCVRAIEAGLPIRIRSPHAVRPWQHVLEPLAGYLMLAERLCADGANFAEAWNFGPADEDTRPVQWVVEEVVRGWGAGVRWEIDGGDKPHEAGLLRLDSSKARSRLGWRPLWPLALGLQKIGAWHSAHAARADMREFTLAQIGEFEACNG
jgi:CDP-glucose 4,6-dehydratase